MKQPGRVLPPAGREMYKVKRQDAVADSYQIGMRCTCLFADLLKEVEFVVSLVRTFLSPIASCPNFTIRC